MIDSILAGEISNDVKEGINNVREMKRLLKIAVNTTTDILNHRSTVECRRHERFQEKIVHWHSADYGVVKF